MSQLFKNSAWVGLTQALPAIIAVASIPRVRAVYGADGFGIIAIAWASVSLLQQADFGTARAVTYLHSQIGSADGSRRRRSALASALALQVPLGLGIFVLLASLVGLFPYRTLAVFGSVRSAVELAALAPALALSAGFRAALEAAGRFDAIAWWRVPQSSSLFLAPLIGSFVGWDVAQALLAISLGVLACAFGLSITAIALGCGRFSFADVDSKLFSRILRFSSWSSVSAVAGAFLIHGEKFVLATNLSSAAVTAYAIPFEVSTRLGLIPMSLATALFPAIASAPDSRQRGIVMREALTLALTPMLVAVGFFSLVGTSVMTLWLGGEVSSTSHLLLMFLVVGAAANACGHIFFGALNGIGRPDISAKTYLFELMFHLPLMIFLVGRFGVLGAAVASSLRLCLDTGLLCASNLRLGILSTNDLRVAVMASARVSLSALAVSIITAVLLQGSPAFVLVAGVAVVSGFTLAVGVLLELRDQRGPANIK